MAVNTPEDIQIKATLKSVSAAKGSTASGATGKLNFECHMGAGEQLFPLVGAESFQVTFGKTDLGEGMSLATVRSRPDENGISRAFFVLLVPETLMPALGLLFSRSLIGTNADLVLGRTQTTLDDQLTRKADEPEGACPFETCILPALHTGKHRLQENEPQTLRAVN